MNTMGIAVSELGKFGPTIQTEPCVSVEATKPEISLLENTSSVSNVGVKCPEPVRSRKRRRVRFGLNDERVEVVHMYETDSFDNSIPQKLKSQLWVQRQDIESSLKSIKKQCLDSKNNNKELPLYEEALCATYLACHDDVNGPEGHVPCSLRPCYLELLGTVRGDNRGLESCVVPSLGLLRKKNKSETVRNLVALHQRLKGVPGESDILRSVAQELSRPSRKFAHAMGIGDALAGLWERKTTPPCYDNKC